MTTASHRHRRYLDPGTGLSLTDEVSKSLCDLRIPLTFDADDCRAVITVIKGVIEEASD